MSRNAQCIKAQKVRLLMCCHCLGTTYTIAVYLPSRLRQHCVLPFLSAQVSVLLLLSCHSAEMKPFLLASTNYKSINSLSHSRHEVSADSALCNPDWQLIFKGCTWLMVISLDLRYHVNPVALFKRNCVFLFFLFPFVSATVQVCLLLFYWWGFNP